MAAPVLTDYHVDHTSTNPANAGAPVKLFVRRRNGTPTGQPSRPVLMLHGRSVPALAGFDLPYKKYSWAEELAKAKFDVFVMELQGSGLSTRPMMDDPKNVSPAPAQRQLLVPHPDASVYLGPVDYAAQLNNSQSDWDEVDKVVDFILGQTGAAEVDLIGWSAAAQQLGPYAIQHPAKVRSLFLLAPIFPPQGRASKPGTDFGAPVPLPVSTPPAAFGYPMTVGTKAGLDLAWGKDLKCPDQREPGIVDEVWKAIMAADPVGATWGGPAGPPQGLNRIRNSYWWGWNATTVPLHGVLGGSVPVCIVYGENDTIVNTSSDLGLLYFSVPELYRRIPGPDKLMFRIACAGHQAPWERVANDLHTMSEHWLKLGKVEGATTGSYYRDEDGALTPLE
ncbi:alpha-beta hydrolase superfamily lysophospholipase [Streptomyces sp. Ag109_G2-6]|uniref:alpha/beta fold hydrolase n=1 Tax=Streptomyces TaxID=1883 RepID=UPI000D1BE6A6|nr:MULTISPECIES: alpha/beta fold hydrolase [Streptomyces]RPF44893.1 alpha-beta hydrolase superfamily lysophospholipase [Streptomyces sp. Ag109_G2-6]